MAAQITRRGFLMGLAATSALTVVRPAFGQALPVYTLPGALSVNGVVSAGTSLSYQGSTVALRSGERYVISRAAQQVAASGVTRAVANRTMSMIATRVLAGAVAASPWGLAALGVGAVAYGAYRYFTADDEAGTNTSTTQYSVIYDQSGAASIQAAVQNNCSGLPANTGNYPHTVILGAYNGSQGCSPGYRQRVVAHCTAAQLPSVVPTPAGWNRAYTFNNGYTDQAQNIVEWWVFFTRSFTNTNGAYQPMVAPVVPRPAEVPAALPDSVLAKPASNAVLADLANGLWQQAVPASDPAVLPWSSPMAVPATAPQPVPVPFTAPANPVPAPVAPPLSDLVNPVQPLAPGAQINFEYPPEIQFQGDGQTNPTNPNPDPNTSIDWGTPPANEALPTVTPMSWFPSLFTPPQLQGTCSGWTIPITTGLPVTLDPCPLMADVIPVVRPVIGVSATIAAGKILLDI